MLDDLIKKPLDQYINDYRRNHNVANGSATYTNFDLRYPQADYAYRGNGKSRMAVRQASAILRGY
jgi:hypothetical protein